MWTNAFLAVIGALGVFMMITFPLWGRVKKNLQRIDRLQGFETEESYPTFAETLRRQGLAAALAQAELPVSRAAFLRLGVLIALVSAAITYTLTGAVLTPLFVGAGSVLMYLQWLFWRRDALRVAYEEALADLCDRMGTGAQLYNTLEGTLAHAAELAPEVLKNDFTQLAAALTQNAPLAETLEAVRKRRRSQAMDLLFDTLLMWQAHGTTRPLAEVLNPLRTSIRELAAERRKLEAEMTLPRLQMFIVAAAPIGFVTLLRAAMPALAQIYASPLGEIIQILAYAIAAVGVVLGERALGTVRRVLDTEA
ncbi:MAG: type II secretion system F family protein [Anaerolineae bacterium]|nr:type II secretion system F family protein [Anaerolineae bacterium]